MKKFLALSGVIFSLVFISPSQRVEAAASFDALSFKPATDHGFYLTVQGSQTLPKGTLHAGLGFDFSNDSLILLNAAGAKVRDIIGKQVAAHVATAIGLTDWLNAGLLIDFVPYQEFFVPATGAGDNGFRMGDMRLDFKLRLLDTDQLPIGLALVPFVTFPTGSDSHFTGNGKFTGGSELVIESKRFANRFSMALNVGAQIRKGTALSQGTTIDDQFLYGAAANFAINRWAELIAEARGWTKFEDFFGSDFRPLMARGAVRLFPHPKVAVTVGGGAAVVNGMGAPTYETFMNVAYVPAYRHYQAKPKTPVCPDADSDGVCDLDDRCPTEPGPASNCGCPPQPLMEVDHEAKEIRNQKIHFEFNKAIVREESYLILDTIARTLKVRPDITHVRIIGHTDSRGSDAYNQKLSERRASAVREYLANQGMQGGRMSHFGKGETEPIASNRTAEDRSKNRRVQFEIDVLSREVTCKK